MKIIEVEDFTRVLSRLSLGENPECMQIGANDGVCVGAKLSGKDYLYDFLMENREWRALLTDPVPAAFVSLRTKYANRPEKTAFLNCAIADRNGRQKIQSNGGDGFRTSTLAAHSNNEKKPGFGGYFDIPVLTYQLACELAGFRDVKFVKIDAENSGRLIVQTILKNPFLGKFPVIIQWEENHPRVEDPNVSQLKNLGYSVVKTGPTKHGVYADRIAFHHSVVRNFVEYFSPKEAVKHTRSEAGEGMAFHKSPELKITHPLGNEQQIFRKSPKIIQEASVVNTSINKIIQEKNISLSTLKNILSKHYLNFNTKFFIDKESANFLIKSSYAHCKKYIVSRIHEERKTNELISEYLIYLRALVGGDKSFILWRVLISPNSVISYLRLSETYSPYDSRTEDIPEKLKYIQRSYYCIPKNDAVFYALQRKIWDQSASNYLVNKAHVKNYPFPLFTEKNVFGVTQIHRKIAPKQKIYFLSTPASGTQSIIFILSHLSNRQFHQYNYFRVQQEQFYFFNDLFTSIEEGMNIHSHLPLPRAALRILLDAGYKIVVLQRDASAVQSSTARHVARRPSYYPLENSHDSVDYFREVTEFVSKFENLIDLHIDYSQLKNSTEEIISTIDQKFFQNSPDFVQTIKQKYKEMLSGGKLNFRGEV